MNLSKLNKNLIILILTLGFSFFAVYFLITYSDYFIYWADFRLPATSRLYFEKHFFIWGSQNSATNLDGIFRVFFRLPNILVFHLTKSNIAVSYFYIFSVVVFNFFSLYYFNQKVLSIKDRLTNLVLSLAYSFNPVFLGNTSKIGLVLATSSALPMATSLFLIFRNKKIFPYNIAFIIFLNISLLHPFNLVVNVFSSLVIFLILCKRNLKFIISKKLQVALTFVLIILSHLYIILPVFVTRNLDKSSISNSIGTGAGVLDLTEIAINKNIFEALSLSKSVLIDFNYYVDSTKLMYFYGSFGIILILVLLLYINKKQTGKINPYSLSLFGVFLFLILILTGRRYSMVDQFYNFLQLTPASWIFRSPLKWQLYIPIFIYSIMAIEFARIKTKTVLLLFKIGLTGCVVFTSITLVYEISYKLLKPIDHSVFTAVKSTELSDKSILFINSKECRDFGKEENKTFNELIHILTHNGGLFNILNQEEEFDNYGLLKNYNYIVTCNDDISYSLSPSRFQKIPSDNDFGINFFKNLKPLDQIYISNDYVTMNNASPNSVRNYSKLSQSTDFDIINSDDFTAFTSSDQYNNLFPQPNSTNFQGNTMTFKIKTEDLISSDFVINSNFNIISYEISDSKISFYSEPIGELFINTVPVSLSDKSEIFSKEITTGDYLIINNTKIPLEVQDQVGLSYRIKKLAVANQNGQETQIPIENQFTGLDFAQNLQEVNTFKFVSDYFDFDNSISNASFDNDSWNEAVLDCFNYDDNPIISKEVVSEFQGKQNSLVLKSTRHNACQKQQFRAIPFSEIFYELEINNPVKSKFGYTLESTDKFIDQVRKVYVEQTDSWQYYTHYHSLDFVDDKVDLILTVFEDESKENQVYFDDVNLIAYPDLNNLIFQYQQNNRNYQNNAQVLYHQNNPTSYAFTVQNVDETFLLSFLQRFSDGWKVQTVDGDNLNIPQSKANIVFNSFELDPLYICNTYPDTCEFNPDGSYTLYLQLYYFPQKFFQTGLYISFITFSLMIISLLFYRVKTIQSKTSTLDKNNTSHA